MTTQPLEIYDILAEKYNISTDLVKEIIEFFYKGVKSDQYNMISHEIYVAGLGSFELKEFRSKHFLRHLSRKIETEESYNTDKFKTIQLNVQRLLDKLEAIKKEKREFHEFHRKASRDISESEQDLGRSQEQDV